MKYVTLPDNSNRKLPFYLTMEEYVASHHLETHGDLFFMWQVEPSVIFGRNQVIDREVDLDYCQTHNIQTYRRRSGGGCVYADKSNIMFSYITASGSNVSTTFKHYTSMIADMLRSLGLDAHSTGRNDIFIGNRKVSGNAFYHRPGRSIVHGTMLYDTDMTHMINAITPSRSKLDSKGVASVQSCITTLREHIDMSIDDFKNYTRQYLCGSNELTLDRSDIERIHEMSKPYYSPQWIMGHIPKGAVTVRKRVEGAGEFEVTLSIDHNTIQSINLGGDFFLISDIDTQLLSSLEGIPYTRKAVEAAIDNTDVSKIIHGLTTQEFINLLF
ncbi:MAG: lipoyltransferase [Paramuribaculum sp.]|nr:lipoyltransferase [Paramuribaculum sp.]